MRVFPKYDPDSLITGKELAEGLNYENSERHVTPACAEMIRRDGGLPEAIADVFPRKPKTD